MFLYSSYDVPKLSQYMDYVSIMTYDYHGQWDKQTGHVAPMYDHYANSDKAFNVVSAIRAIHIYITMGISKYFYFIILLSNFLLSECLFNLDNFLPAKNSECNLSLTQQLDLFLLDSLKRTPI